MEDYVKQVIVLRKDLSMRRGKECAQAAHASMLWLVNRLVSRGTIHVKAGHVEGAKLVGAYEFEGAERLWLMGKFTKIVVTVYTEFELLDLADHAQQAIPNTHLIKDSGQTEFKGVPTFTALAIGPDWASKIDPLTKDLKLY